MPPTWSIQVNACALEQFHIMWTKKSISFVSKESRKNLRGTKCYVNFYSFYGFKARFESYVGLEEREYGGEPISKGYGL
jgi:hypothetical protein